MSFLDFLLQTRRKDFALLASYITRHSTKENSARTRTIESDDQPLQAYPLGVKAA